jgi:competence protein ComEC
LDVGQGDAVLLRTPEGDVLIDAGTEDSELLLCRRLEQLGVKRLKLAILTHFDEDHVGGADAVIRRFLPETIWVGTQNAETEAAIRLLQAASEVQAEICHVCAGELYVVGKLALYVMYPFSMQTDGGNENSLVVRMQYGNVSALFMGDAGVEQERLLIDHFGKSQLSVDLCKIGHHGSNTSTSQAFLECAQPRYAVISCGEGNAYGHPMGGVLANLEHAGVSIFRTDVHGEIVFVSNGESFAPIID